MFKEKIQPKSNFVKTQEEIELMRISGKICAQVLQEVLTNVRPNVSCLELDSIAKEAIEKQQAISSFMTVDTYRWTICTTINNQVVHGIPTTRVLKEGDIIGIDIGALYKGFHTDMAITVPVGKISQSTQKFLDVGAQALRVVIKKAKVGARIGDISAKIQGMIEGAGYAVVKSLTGHGVGRELHEKPMVPGFGKSGTGPKISKDMTLAIEVIYTQGSGEFRLEEDGWTIVAKDGSLSGLFEQTILTTQNGPIVLTPYL